MLPANCARISHHFYPNRLPIFPAQAVLPWRRALSVPASLAGASSLRAVSMIQAIHLQSLSPVAVF
ncbi:hypothetical protein D3C87_1814250 [compost metagenome]